MKVEFHNQTAFDVTKTKTLIRKIFKEISEDKNMQVVFVTNDQIKELNKQFRNIDKKTDVLSFPNDEKEDTSLGDIFISLEKANEQALDYAHSIEREIGFLAVHGYLHLKGYDHHTPEEEKEMIALQKQILDAANLKR